MKAKKSFGQHFLINENVTKRIVDALSQDDGLPVLEIGPGKGVLTKYLIERYPDFRVVEADRDMIAYLENNFPLLKENIIFLDFLKLNLAKVFEGRSFKMIGNYPYNISSQIVMKMVKHRNLIPEMVGMFQKEVAERMISPHGNKVYGAISVLIQAYYRGKMIVRVSPGSFNPPPKVHSAVIRLDRLEEPYVKDNDQLFRSVVKVSFNQRRKMLRNSLKGMIQEPSLLQDTLLTSRPEQLSVEQFVQLTNLIEESNHIYESRK